MSTAPVSDFFRVLEAPVARTRWWLHALLLVLTFLTTTATGARLAVNFRSNVPAFSDPDLGSIALIWRDPAMLWEGLPYSLTLVLILLAHELGHYFTCIYYGVDATPPFFLPAPTLIGTMGAFIKVRSPILTKAALFDIGIAGPLAGFAILLPALAIGVAWSKLLPGIAAQGDLVFGVPLLEQWLKTAMFPGAGYSDVYLHPMARAAWAGMLATALNLLPIGQLDGGHILYSLTGRWHKWLSRIFIALLAVLGFAFSYSWLVWALLLLLFGMRHPIVYDPRPLSGGRRLLALLALAVFAACFTATPVALGDMP